MNEEMEAYLYDFLSGLETALQALTNMVGHALDQMEDDDGSDSFHGMDDSDSPGQHDN